MLMVVKSLDERLVELRDKRAQIDTAIQKLETLQQRRLQIRDKVRRINAGVLSFPSAA